MRISSATEAAPRNPVNCCVCSDSIIPNVFKKQNSNSNHYSPSYFGLGVNRFLWCMGMVGCGLRTFFMGYFHFLPLAKIPPVVINNSIPLSGFFFFFSSVSHSWLLACQLGRSRRCRVHTCWQSCGWKKLTISTSTLLFFHPNDVPWKHNQGREEGQTEAKVQIVWSFAFGFRIYTYFSDVFFHRPLTGYTWGLNENTNPPLFSRTRITSRT